MSTSTERKSAESLTFEHYLRTGEYLTSDEWFARHERKFNPNHDPNNGQFTFGSGGTGYAKGSRGLAKQSGRTIPINPKKASAPEHISQAPARSMTPDVEESDEIVVIGHRPKKSGWKDYELAIQSVPGFTFHAIRNRRQRTRNCKFRAWRCRRHILRLISTRDQNGGCRRLRQKPRVSALGTQI